MNVTGAYSGEVEAEAGARWPCPTENLELGHLREDQRGYRLWKWLGAKEAGAHAQSRACGW